MATTNAFVCLRCWKQKKKCDRRLPNCNRCTSSDVKCTYSAHPPVDRVERWQPRTFTVEQFCTLAEALHGKNGKPITLYPAPPNGPLSFSAASQILNEFQAIRHEIHHICGLYLRTKNSWLPVVIDANLLAQLDVLEIKKNPEPEICMLMLCIYLLTHEPTPATDKDKTLDRLYSVLKPLHYSLQCMGAQSIVTIQVGMLLAIYEHGQALQIQSFMTIGACARMGHAIGLHKTISSQTSPHELDSQLEDRRQVWWCVIALERILALDDLESSLPFATTSPTLSSILPTSPNFPTPSTPLPLGTQNPHSPVSEISFPNTNPLARSAQAIYLLDRVFTHLISTNQPSTDTSSFSDVNEIEFLDKTLQAFLLSILAQCAADARSNFLHSCGAYYIAVSALLTLHTHILSLPNSSCSLEIKAKSTLSLQTLSRMPRQSYASSNSADQLAHNVAHMPPFAFGGFRVCRDFSREMLSQLHRDKGEERMGEEGGMGMGRKRGEEGKEKEEEEERGWRENFEFLDGVLEVAAKRWRGVEAYY